MVICQNRGPIVARDTSFKCPFWLIEFVYEAFIHCQTFDREECLTFEMSQLLSSIFPKSQQWARHACKSSEMQQTTIQRRGVWDILQTASCSFSMALVAQRTIWLLCGLATCLGSECVSHWLVASGFCALFWQCLSLIPSLLVSSGLPRVSWEPGWLPPNSSQRLTPPPPFRMGAWIGPYEPTVWLRAAHWHAHTLST